MVLLRFFWIVSTGFVLNSLVVGVSPPLSSSSRASDSATPTTTATATLPNVTKLDCGMRLLALQYAKTLTKPNDLSTWQHVHDALRLTDLCHVERPVSTDQHDNAQLSTHRHRKTRSIQQSMRSPQNAFTECTPPLQYCVHVMVPSANVELDSFSDFPERPRTQGMASLRERNTMETDNKNNNSQNLPGSIRNPFTSLHDALEHTRIFRNKTRAEWSQISHQTQNESQPTISIVLHPGIHSIKGKPLILTKEDSGLKIIGYHHNSMASSEGTNVWLSGGIALDDHTVTFEEDGDTGIYVANLTHLWFRTSTSRDTKEFERLPFPKILSLFTTSRRYIRARYPNGDPETVQWGYASPQRLETSLKSNLVLEWHLPPKGQPPEFKFVDFSPSDPSLRPTGVPSKNDSTQIGYNWYASGKGGVCNDVWGKDADSYWCSNASQGGWAEVDRECAMTGQLQLPIGFTYNISAPELERLQHDTLPGAIVHAWHSQSWAMHMFEIAHHVPKTGVVRLAKGGGKQGGRNWCRCDQCTYAGSWCGQHQTPPWDDTRLISGSWLIENVREELDQSGEYYFDKKTKLLYVKPNSTLDLVDFRIGLSEGILELRDDASNITIAGVGFRDTAPTYHPESDWSAPSGGDWSLHRGGAIFLENVNNVTIEDCRFQRLDGNAIFLSRRTRNVTIQRNYFEWLGENAIATWGDTDDYDGTGENFPMDTRIVGNVMRELGIFEKQSSALGQAKAARTIIHGNIMFNMPRAAINFNDMLGGGDSLYNNLIFNTCRESGDHGPINSWDRQPFLTTLKDGETKSFEPIPRMIEANFIIANYGASQGVDNDDGSSWFHIRRNLFYSAEGFKMDYGGHDSIFEDNLVMAFPYDGSQCYNMGGFYPWHGDTLRRNRCLVGLGRKMGSGCGDPSCANPDAETDESQQTVGHLWNGCLNSSVKLTDNEYYTPDGVAKVGCGDSEVLLEEVSILYGLEMNSSVARLPDEDTMIKWAKSILPSGIYVDL